MRRNIGDASNLLLNRFGIGEYKSLGALGAGSDAVDATPTGFNPDHVVTEVCDLLLNLVGGSSADRYTTNHRRDADDDSEHCEHTSHLVACQCQYGNTQNCDQTHTLYLL